MDLERRSFALRHLYVYPRLRLAYTYIPKNACTSFKRAFGEAQGWLTADSPSAHLMKRQWWLSSLARYPQTTERVLVVRDPLDRVLSAYMSKFVGATDHIAAHSVESALAERLPPGSTHDDVTFADFVNYLARTPSRRLDDHWRPQHDFLIGGYTRVVRFEHLAEDTAFLAERGLSLQAFGRATSTMQSDLGSDWGHRPARRLRVLRRRRGVLPARTNMYDDDLHAMVKARYAEDLALHRRADHSALAGGKVGH